MQDDIGEPIVPKCFLLADRVGRYKKRRRDAEVFKNGKCVKIIIVETVIESDDDRLGRKRRFAIQGRYQISEGNGGKVAFYVIHLPGKVFYRGADQFNIEGKT